MPSVTWRRALRHLATVKRPMTSTSPSGASRANAVTIQEHVRCTIQDAGGRMKQDDAGVQQGRKKTSIFGTEAAAFLAENDTVVLENFEVGQSYRVVHVHHVPYGGGVHHLEVQLEQHVDAQPSGPS